MKNRDNLKVQFLDISELKPYENNPRINDNAIDIVAESIKEFGFNNPIILDTEKKIICGHTRYKASKKLDIKKIPCLILDDLTDDEIKAFRIIDNKTNEYASWNFSKLEEELKNIDLDLSNFNLDYSFLEEEVKEHDYYGDERERTYNTYNLNDLSFNSITNDFWQMPIIENDNYIPKDLIGFNYAKTSKNKKVGIHFYIDDYQFERLWNNPSKYTDLLSEYDCILSPDFSLYLDMPMPIKIWNIYRSRFLGAFYQSQGLRVIPTISWAEEETFNFCFLGIPKKSIVSISTIGVKKDENLQIFRKGLTEMINQIQPKIILIYGGEIDFDFKGIKVIYFKNHITEEWKKESKKWGEEEQVQEE